MSELINKIEDLENLFFQIEKLNELNDKMDRVKHLMDATGMSIEEMLADTAPAHVCCDTCPISSFCDKHPYNEDTQIGCSDVWLMYLKGEIDG